VTHGGGKKTDAEKENVKQKKKKRGKKIQIKKSLS